MQDDTWSRNWRAAHEKKERAKMASENSTTISHKIAAGRANRILELEQQLAQAREENVEAEETIATFRQMNKNQDATIQRMKAENAQARALLEKLANGSPHYYDADGLNRCACCGVLLGLLEHEDDCEVKRARAFLAREEGE